jgi:hypothetical protein
MISDDPAHRRRSWFGSDPPGERASVPRIPRSRTNHYRAADGMR